MPLLALKGQKVFITTITAPNPCKLVMQNLSVQVTIDHLSDIRTKEPIRSFKPLFVDVFKGQEMIFHALIIHRPLGIALPMDRCGHGYATSVYIDEKTGGAISVPTLHVGLVESGSPHI